MIREAAPGEADDLAERRPHVLVAEDVGIKSPADGGLPPYELDRIVGLRLRRRLAPDENLEIADLEPAEEPVAAHAAPRP